MKFIVNLLILYSIFPKLLKNYNIKELNVVKLQQMDKKCKSIKHSSKYLNKDDTNSVFNIK